MLPGGHPSCKLLEKLNNSKLARDPFTRFSGPVWTGFFKDGQKMSLQIRVHWPAVGLRPSS